MRPWGSLWLGVLCLLLPHARGFGLDPSRHISQYGHTVWRTQDGQVSETSPIAQTTDGYIWIGNSNGTLSRFDGVRFVPWAPPADSRFVVRHVTALLGASDGSLWIGTSSGLGRLKDGHFHNYYKPEDRWGIFSIIEDRAGRIWVTRYHLSGQKGTICQVQDQALHCYGPAEGVPLAFGAGLAEDTHGNFWVGANGLCRWRPGSSCTTYFNNPDDEDAGIVATAPAGTVWAVVDASGRKGGLYRFSDEKWTQYSVPGFDSTTAAPSVLWTDRDGSLWIGTYKKGLYRIHNGVVDHYGPPDGLSGYIVSNLFEDREGNMWVSTDGGVDMFRNMPVVTYSIGEGLTSAQLLGILAARDGSIWIANSDDGVDVLRDNKRQNPTGWPSQTVQEPHSLFEDHAGTIWITSGNNVTAWDHGRLSFVKRSDGAPLGGPLESLNGITEDTAHNLWVLSKSYLLRIDDKRVKETTPLPKEFVPSGILAPDLENGGLWIGDQADHIFHYQNGQFQTTTLQRPGNPSLVKGLIVDSDDPLLVATSNGLFRWDGREWTVLNTQNNLPCPSISSMVKDNHGALWLYAQCGLVEIEASELLKWRADPNVKIASRVFDRFKGAYPGAKYTAQPLATRAPDGRIWFSTGLVVQAVDPDHLFPNNVVPPVHVEGIIADENMYQPAAPIRLPPRTRNTEIDYTALSLSIPQEVRFRYRLEGRDLAWQDPGTRRQAFYTDLHPGNYTFRVIASNSDGVWNEAGAALPFSVAPAFDQTAWFRCLCILAGAAVLWMLYWLRLRQATEQLHERLGARLEERERIARELHDTLLQSFNALLLRLQTVSNVLPARPEEAKKRVDSAIEQAAGAITEGRDALHELRSGGLRTIDISESISSFGKELIAGSPPQNSPEIRVQAEGTPRELNANVRDEVYRIAVEALRNAFRHAQARQIEAEIKYDDQHFSLHVRDDGKGIDPNVLERGRVLGHWGLHGMRERASLIGGKFEAWSKPDSGTEIELSIPAAIAYEKPSTSRWYLFNRRNRRG